MLRFASLLWLAITPALSIAQSVELDLTGVAPGSKFVVVVNPDGKSVTVRPLTQSVKLASLGPTVPTDPTDPTVPPDQPTELTLQVEKSAKAVLTAGGSKVTAAGLSSVCSLLAEEVKAGRIATGDTTKAAAQGFDKVLGTMADGGKWFTFRIQFVDALNELQAKGLLRDKEQWAGALLEFSAGLDRAVGETIVPRELASLSGAQLAKADALFENFDIEQLKQLIELIKMLIDLFRSFGGAGQ